MHYAYHIGQIVFIGKLLKGANWKPISIAKGKSKAYNKDKSQNNRAKGHFTDDH